MCLDNKENTAGRCFQLCKNVKSILSSVYNLDLARNHNLVCLKACLSLRPDIFLCISFRDCCNRLPSKWAPYTMEMRCHAPGGWRRERRACRCGSQGGPGRGRLFWSSACADRCLLFMSSHCLALCVCIQMALFL